MSDFITKRENIGKILSKMDVKRSEEMQRFLNDIVHKRRLNDLDMQYYLYRNLAEPNLYSSNEDYIKLHNEILGTEDGLQKAIEFLKKYIDDTCYLYFNYNYNQLQKEIDKYGSEDEVMKKIILEEVVPIEEIMYILFPDMVKKIATDEKLAYNIIKQDPKYAEIALKDFIENMVALPFYLTDEELKLLEQIIDKNPGLFVQAALDHLD